MSLLDNPKTSEQVITDLGADFVDAATTYIAQDQTAACMVRIFQLTFATLIVYISLAMLSTLSWGHYSVIEAGTALICVSLIAIITFVSTFTKNRDKTRIAVARKWLSITQTNMPLLTAIRVITTPSYNNREQYQSTLRAIYRAEDMLTTFTGKDFLQWSAADRTRFRSIIKMSSSQIHTQLILEILRALGEAQDSFARDEIQNLASRTAYTPYEEIIKTKANEIMLSCFNYPQNQRPDKVLLRAAANSDEHQVLVRPAGYIEMEQDILLRSTDNETEK